VDRSQPGWRRLVDGIEQRLADPLESLVRHDAVGVTLAVATRGVVAVRRVTERNSRRVLHTLNIPAASDINRLLAHIAVVEREVRMLSARSAGLTPPRVASRPRPPAALGASPAE